MSLPQFFRRRRAVSLDSTLVSRRAALRAGSERRRRAALLERVELLEDRTLLSTFTVTNLADSGAGSLRDAIDQANGHAGADVVRFQAGLSGTVTLTSGQLEISDDLTLDGPGANRITISGNNASRVFAIDPGVTATIDRLTIADGLNTIKESVPITVTRGGGILNDGGTLTLSFVTMRNNRVVNDSSTGLSQVVGGGAVVNSTNATLTVTYCTFINNTATGGTSYAFGGAIGSVTNSVATIRFCTFTGNEANGGGTSYGGAIGNFGDSDLVVSYCSFDGNTARGTDSDSSSGGPAFGGAIATRPGTVNDSGSTTEIDHSLFTNNRALGGAGGSTGFGGNAGGGALYSIDSALEVAASSFFGNLARGGAGGTAGGAALGGAIEGLALNQTDSAATRISGSLFTNNQALGGSGPSSDAAYAAGGALYNGGSVLDVCQTWITGNAARGGQGANAYGGGIFSGNSALPTAATLTIRQSVVSGNTARGGSGGQGQGGGIYNGNLVLGATPPVATMLSSIVVGNQALGGAGGIGGGIYTTGTFNASPIGFFNFNPLGSVLFANRATTSNDNVFGTLTPV